MTIENVNYQTDMLDVHNIRYLLFRYLYGDMSYIQNLSSIIERHIECLNNDYSAAFYTFTIKIKKTAMRKFPGFEHNPNFYYQIISNIFKEFLQSNQNIVIEILKTKYQEPEAVLNNLYNNYTLMANLCHVSCLADNVLIIKL